MRSTLKKAGVSLFFLVLLVSVVCSLESPGPYRLNEDAFLIQNCANCSYVNITTVILGNKTEVTLNQNMTQDGTFYHYILDSSYITYPGDYIVNGFADPDGIKTVWSYSFPVSQLGIKQTTSQGIGSAIFLVLMVCLMFVFGGVGLRLFKSDTWWILGLFFVFFASLLLVYNTWLGYQYHILFTGLPNSAMPERIFWMLLLIVVLGLLVSAGLLFMRWKQVLRYVKREMRRKEPRDEDLEDWDFDQWGGEDWRVRR